MKRIKLGYFAELITVREFFSEVIFAFGVLEHLAKRK